MIFDLDGTLVDSMWMWHSIDVEFLQTYGHTCPDDLHRMIEGMSFTQTAVYFQERFQLPLSIEEIKQIWTRMCIDKYRYEVPLKPGAREFLEYLKSRGICCGIATSNGQEIVLAVLDSLDIRSYFQVVATSCEVKVGKPEPDIYEALLRKYQLQPTECVFVDDIRSNIIAANHLGMATIHFHTKSQAEEELRSLGVES